MTDTFTVEIIDRNDSVAALGEFATEVQNRRFEHPRCILRLEFNERTMVADEADFFHALCSIRCELDQDGLRPRCYGASRNVWPSGMSASMSLGLKAYKLRKSEHARLDDIVHIFDVGPDVEPVTVDEQKAFHKSWVDTFGRKYGKSS